MTIPSPSTPVGGLQLHFYETKVDSLRSELENSGRSEFILSGLDFQVDASRCTRDLCFCIVAYTINGAPFESHAATFHLT